MVDLISVAALTIFVINWRSQKILNQVHSAVGSWKLYSVDYTSSLIELLVLLFVLAYPLTE